VRSPARVRLWAALLADPGRLGTLPSGTLQRVYVFSPIDAGYIPGRAADQADSVQRSWVRNSRMGTDRGQQAMAAIALLADELRQRPYRFVRAQPSLVTRDQAATAAGISRKLAAFHLGKLAAAGLLETTTPDPDSRRPRPRPRPQGLPAGRDRRWPSPSPSAATTCSATCLSKQSRRPGQPPPGWRSTSSPGTAPSERAFRIFTDSFASQWATAAPMRWCASSVCGGSGLAVADRASCGSPA
jgi:hypothetical protein